MALPSSNQSGDLAAERVAALFRAHSWGVDAEQGTEPFRPDLVVRNGSTQYAVEVKAEREGRPDRVLALLSQAILQVRRQALQSGMCPLAIVHVGQFSPALQRKVEQFHRDYAPDVAVGVVSETSGSYFIGAGLQLLNVEAPRRARQGKAAKPRKASDLFSDLNQWMLKVLLAPEIPDRLLHAPRADYRSMSQLAAAANVSLMSASRFLQRLREDGFLDDASGVLRVVRRRELFRLWQSAALRSSAELRMCFLIPGAGTGPVQKAAERLDACVGLFAAADLLKLGHVSGALPHLYLHRLAPTPSAEWPGLVAAGAGEPPHLILKQANAPESMFRGALRVDNVLVSDVLQLWLDASAHPSRGAEQAELLRNKVLAHVLGDGG
ncbi:hypothetical protein [Stenotrophomonas cyclobalanopsidis]|uniref:hypothetical protein n=1 Tax=Stenotrophomonas cyclobalanopsidis TaxID=2771362 RepID=UPI0028AAB1FB|nr:hypothetical protein [Stenotrophomonas cyclobalanopsidis]